MQISVSEIVNTSPAIKSNTAVYSENFILDFAGILNIYNNLTDSDLEKIRAAKGKIKNPYGLSLVQFAREDFAVSGRTFEIINEKLLAVPHPPRMNLKVRDMGVFENFLRRLGNMKFLGLNVPINENPVPIINKHLDLKGLYASGKGVSFQEIGQQKNIEEIFIGGDSKKVEFVRDLIELRKITCRKTMKNFDFLVGLKKLQEVSFICGSGTDYSSLTEIKTIEKISFTLVRKLKEENLHFINRMENLKELVLDTQSLIASLDWIENKNLKVTCWNCKLLK